MTREEKDLLLKDLCARLPYGVVVGTTDNDGTIPNFWSFDAYNRLTEDVMIINCEVNADRLTWFGDVRPYLFPLSSMTEEQRRMLDDLSMNEPTLDISGERQVYITNNPRVIDWFNKNHFDWRNLIPMELAIDATGLNVY